MLNLALIFEHAVEAFEEFGEALEVPPLPVAVYLMQRDVINHYRHALTHYFPISLSAHYLQNSSIGTPFEKWRKFTNDDFGMLAFAIHNLIRYSGRLVHETLEVGLRKQDRLRERGNRKQRSDSFTAALCDIALRQRQIGIQINLDNSLEITPFNYDGLANNRLEIGNRELLVELCAAGNSEISSLISMNEAFGKLCLLQQAKEPLAIPYTAMNISWCV